MSRSTHLCGDIPNPVAPSVHDLIAYRQCLTHAQAHIARSRAVLQTGNARVQASFVRLALSTEALHCLAEIKRATAWTR